MMSKSGIDYINSNPELVRAWIENVKKAGESYAGNRDELVVPLFEQELRELGYGFEISSQIIGFMPKHKETILPIAVKYFKQAKDKNEKWFFAGFFRFKGFDEFVPLLLEEFYSDTPGFNRWQIGDIIEAIRSKKYIDDYLKIIANPAYGRDRQMVVLLVGKLKVESAIPILINLLEEEDVRLHAIVALGDYKREDFRPYFERFENDKHSGWRKYARAALKKLPSYRKLAL
ncbi:MAG: HEAT repeat domain-containing protein [Firmicutes bacterium]|nr:HEAT repeat domain-containing protein [Bacillota bacterium]